MWAKGIGQSGSLRKVSLRTMKPCQKSCLLIKETRGQNLAAQAKVRNTNRRVKPS